MFRKMLSILHSLCTALAAVMHRRRRNTRRTIARAVRTGSKTETNRLADELTKDL